MQRHILAVFSIGLILFMAYPLSAGVIVNKQTWSAENIRTLNRNASTDSADASVYNPAGVMGLDDGLYTSISVYYSPTTVYNTINGSDHESETSPVVPSGFLVYKTPRYAAYFGSNVVLGGGSVDYDNGNVTTVAMGTGLISSFNQALAANSIPEAYWYTGIRSQNIEAESFGYGYTLGGAVSINDKVSVSLGIRYVDSISDASGQVTIEAENSLPPYNDDATHYVDFEQKAQGWGWIIGLCFTPRNDVTIGLRYESRISLDYDTTVNEDRNTASDLIQVLPLLGITDGNEVPNDLPAVLASGLSYRATDRLRVETSFSYYFQEDADWNGLEDRVDNGYETGIAVEYAFTPRVKGSIGYLYSNMGDIHPEDMSSENPQLSFDSFGIGAAWSVTPRCDINLGFCRLFYKDEGYVTTSGARIDYDKDLDFIAVGVQYKWM